MRTPETQEQAEELQNRWHGELYRLELTRPRRGTSESVHEWVVGKLKEGVPFEWLIRMPGAGRAPLRSRLFDFDGYGTEYGALNLTVRLKNVSPEPLKILLKTKTTRRKVPVQRGDIVVSVSGGKETTREIHDTLAPGGTIELPAVWAAENLEQYSQSAWSCEFWGESAAIPQTNKLVAEAYWSNNQEFAFIDTREPEPAPQPKRRGRPPAVASDAG